MTRAMITPAQQAEIQAMMNTAFEARMKKEVFPNDDILFIKYQFAVVVKNFCFNNINIKAAELKAIIEKNKDFTYFEIGTMLNCIMSASFEKNGISNEGIVEFISTIEPLQDKYNEFVEVCRKASRSEVKTKLRLQNSPLEHYL